MSKVTIPDLNNMRKRCRIGYIIYGIVLALGFVLLFVGKTYPAFVVLAGGLVAYFIMLRPDLKAYSDAWRELYLESFASRHLTNVLYTYKPDADALGLKEEQLLPPGPEKGFLVRNLITGRKQNLEVALSDATLPTRVGARNQFITGGRICIQGLKLPLGHVRLVAPNLPPVEEQAGFITGTLGLTETEPVASMHVYTDAQGWTPDEPTVRAIRALTECAKQPMVIDCKADRMTVFIQHRLVNVQPPALKYNLPENVMDRADYPELSAALHLALVMNTPERAREEAK